MQSNLLLPPILRQIVLRIAQDLQDRLSVASAKVAETAAVMAIREHVVHLLVHIVLHRIGQLREGLRIDEITAREFEKPTFQIERAQRSPFLIMRALFHELGGKRRCPLDLVREPELWPAPLEALVRDLVPPLPVEAPIGSEPPPAPERSLRPWVLWAGGAAMLGVGIGFGASSAAARARASRPLGPESEAIYAEAADRAQSHAIVADVSFVLSAVTVAVGGVIYWLETD